MTETGGRTMKVKVTRYLSEQFHGWVVAHETSQATGKIVGHWVEPMPKGRHTLHALPE